MIYFILAKRNGFTIPRFLRERGKPLKENIHVLHYEDLSSLKFLECTALVFSDLDIISHDQLAQARMLHDQICEEHPDLTIFNNPHKVKLRYELLRSLNEKGINPFNVYRHSDELDILRFPVFIRQENNHIGPLTSLIHNSKDLEANLLSLQLQGWDVENLLIVEYHDVKTIEGYYTRYAAFRIGTELYPYLLDYNSHWMAKYVDSPYKDGEEYAVAFEEFVLRFRDKSLLMSVFEEAKIEYGRVDYSLCNGQPVVWEINLNPDYEYEDQTHKHFSERVRSIKRKTNANIVAHFKKLDTQEKHIIDIDSMKVREPASSNVNRQSRYYKSRLRMINSIPMKKELLAFKRLTYLTLARLIMIIKGHW